MPDVKTKRELATEAVTLAQSFSLVRHSHMIYMPADYETGDYTVTPSADRTIWVPLTREDIQQRALEQFNTLFETSGSLDSFIFMVAQSSIQHTAPSTSLLVRTAGGLKELKEDGKLSDPSGNFVPNTLEPVLNETPDDKEELFATLSDWVGSEEEALVMLRHFATALAPGWSAVKYVLLLGSGRNGKSLMMHMLQEIFGKKNCSNVSRQDISDKSPAVTDLNGKLLNIVFDGPSVFLKDSGYEKSLIAGEAVGIRKLYTSELTPVQTNALFVEGLNREPKSSDKSSALQARIIRFWFPNVYELDQGFWARMTSERFLGALLSLLIDNYVQPHEVAVMLSPSAAAIDLQLDHMYENSLGLQFVKYVEDTDPLMADVLIDMEVTELVARFQSWRIKMNDLQVWSEPEVMNLFRPLVDTERRSKRVGGMPRKLRVISTFKRETSMFISRMREEITDDTAVVDD